VGFLLADATKVAAEANPTVQFAIVDSNTSAANVQGLTFATDQPSFLAGYMAAATTKTGIVGTFGGINIPPVSIFMQGFAKGVEYYNAQKGASVKVLGWDMAKQDGTFAGNFNSLDDGRNIAKSQSDEGADIIFPVAGPVGLGASAFAMESGGKVKIIGVDVDMSVSNATQAEVYVGSVLKKIDAAVLAAVDSALKGEGGGTDYLGTLANGGVGVAITSTITPELQAELDAITAGIIDGSIVTK
jgi:basic membrane protein A